MIKNQDSFDDLKKVDSGMHFVVLDGLDGCGKDTQARNVARYFAKKKQKVLIRSHPAEDNYFGRNARKYLRATGTKAHLLAAIFYAIDVLRSLLYYYRPSHARIIFVRYLMGTAYLPGILMRPLYSIFAAILPTVSCSILIDIRPSIARQRILQRGEVEEMFESEPRLVRMRERMYFLARTNGWIIVDGNQSPMKTWTQIEGQLRNLNSNCS